jgi:hypothetical protein
MATTTYYMSPITLLIQMFSNIGIPLAGGSVETYLAGTTTPVTTYTDSTGTTQNQNPISLSPAGRLQSVGGAPVACWVPQGTAHKMVILDSSSNFVMSIDNLTAINDPSTLLALLSTVSTPSVLGGADIVANAMRSYDVLATVRAAQVPSLAAGQTLVIDLEGGTLVNDGNGGLFYWSATSTATDDNGLTTIKPNSIASGSPGRYLRQTNLFGSSGTFVVTVIGATTQPTLTVRYVVNGTMVTVSIPDTGALTSNSNEFYLQGWANGIQGVSQQIYSPVMAAEDNSTLGLGAYLIIPTQIGGSNVMIIPNNAGGVWTTSGTKRLYPASFSYVTA